jgi:hypothetical protein
MYHLDTTVDHRRWKTIVPPDAIRGPSEERENRKERERKKEEGRKIGKNKRMNYLFFKKIGFIIYIDYIIIE